MMTNCQSFPPPNIRAIRYYVVTKDHIAMQTNYLESKLAFIFSSLVA